MIIFILIATFAMLLLSVVFHLFLGYALGISLILFTLYALHYGFSPVQVLRMIAKGIKKALSVTMVLFVIGAMTALWMQSGTIPFFITLGTRLISPPTFVLLAFLLSTAMSYLIGTSFGTATTIGVVCMAIARAGGVDPMLTAGAILCGCYIGDRGSPMSSALLLGSAVTGTKLFDNVRMCLRTSLVPLAISLAFFTALSLTHPLTSVSETVAQSIHDTYSTSLLVVLPALIILVMALLRIGVLYAALASGLCAGILCVLLQHDSILSVLRTAVMGYALPASSPLVQLLHGGGFRSMLTTALVVLLSCAISGIVEGTQLSQQIFRDKQTPSRFGLYVRTLLTGFGTAAIGCNQTIAIVLTSEIMRAQYEQMDLPNSELARDVSITAFLTPTLVPWTVAVITPLAALGMSGAGYLPFMIFPAAMMLWHLARYYFNGRKKTHASA